jgi:hypothetical protein
VYKGRVNQTNQPRLKQINANQSRHRALRAAQGEPNSVPPAGRLVEALELKLPANQEHDFRANALKLERVEREPGLNTTGMVAWMMNLKTPECPQGRQVVAIANDITYQSGAFGPKEDCLFRAATELALEERLPLIYLAANRWGGVGAWALAVGWTAWLGRWLKGAHTLRNQTPRH